MSEATFMLAVCMCMRIVYNITILVEYPVYSTSMWSYISLLCNMFIWACILKFFRLYSHQCSYNSMYMGSLSNSYKLKPVFCTVGQFLHALWWEVTRSAVTYTMVFAILTVTLWTSVFYWLTIVYSWHHSLAAAVNV